ncbi:MAG: hypothetical protein O3A26_06570 [Proteobacteria bacterium]|nr:hypothetical protein [Pseudomonadota bacterium]
MTKGYPRDKRIAYQIPTTPEQVLKRIMNDLSRLRKRKKQEYLANREIGSDPNLDIEQIRKIIQDNFKFLGLNISKWMKENT